MSGPIPTLVRINSTVYSWTSCSFKFDNFPLTGIVSVDYSEKRERKIVYANKQDGVPLGRTAGKYSVDSFTMKVLKEDSNSITDYLTIAGGGSYGDAEFTFTAQAVEPVIGSIPISTFGFSCTVDNKKQSYAEGIDELVDEYTIGCLYMVENGKTLWSVTRSLAGLV